MENFAGIALLIIAKGEPLNNTYRLIRILEGQFNILSSGFDSSMVFKYIVDEKLVIDDLRKNGVSFFVITPKGIGFLHDLIVKVSLPDIFPQEEQSIQNLIKSLLDR